MIPERREPTYVLSEKQVADKSEIARRFPDSRTGLNANVEKADNFLVKRFYNLDHNAYLEGAEPAKYKELMGLVASTLLALRRLHPVPHYPVLPSGCDARRAGRILERGADRRRQHCRSTPAAGVRIAERVVRMSFPPTKSWASRIQPLHARPHRIVHRHKQPSVPQTGNALY